MKSDWAYASPKKGEITSQQIVILIILITSFAILLFFLFRLNLGGEADKELCRNSVLLKGKSVFKDSTLLNCKRSYICLTSDGNCDSSDLLKPELKKVKNKNEAYRVLAEEMRDCWWMFGEGKVNYIGDDLTRNNYCSICSQVAFDDSIKEEVFKGNEIDKEDFYKFLKDTNISGGYTTYLEYLYGIKTLDVIEKTLTDQGSGFGTINLNNQQFVMMGIKSDVSTTGWVLGGAAIGAGVVLAVLAAPFTGGTSIPIAFVLIGAGGVAGAGGGGLVAVTVDSASGDEEFLVPTIIGATSEEFRALNCEEVITLS